MQKIESKDSVEVVSENYQDYSRYVIKTRAYPSLTDGCKAVHRRVIYACAKNLPAGRKVKSANAIGEVVKYHPHPNSIYGVIVSMASQYMSPFPLFDTKGNFGGLGFVPAAERYTECCISDLARKIFCQFYDYSDFVDGEIGYPEPKNLPTLIPLCFLHGSYGIPTGMSTVNIPSLNAEDIVKYYIDILKHKDTEYTPNTLVRPNIGNVVIKTSKKEWKDILKNGEGSVVYKPVITKLDNKTISITGIHPSKNIEHIKKILSQEIMRDQIDVRDESTTSIRYVVEVPSYKRVDIDEIYDRLEKRLTTSEKYRFIFADDGIATYCGFHEMIKISLNYLIECCKRKLKSDYDLLKRKIDIEEAFEKIISADRFLDKIMRMKKDKAIDYFSKELKIEKSIVSSALSKSISSMTTERKTDLSAMKNKLLEISSNIRDPFQYLLSIYQSLLKDVKKIVSKKEVSKFE